MKKGKTILERLKEKDAQKNGQHPPQDEPPISGPPVGRLAAYRIIADYWRQRYDPIFRNELTIYSATEGRELRSGELLSEPTPDLIDRLAHAAEASRSEETGMAIRSKLPGLFNTWAKVAWGFLRQSLPFETAAEQLSNLAQEQFQARISAALVGLVPLTYQYTAESGDVRSEIQRRAILHWARLYAQPTRWQSVHSYYIWSRIAGDPSWIQIALRIELFDQLHMTRPVSSQKDFTDLCTMYDVGTAGKVQGGRTRAVILSRSYLHEVTAQPVDEAETNEESQGQADSVRPS